MQLTNEERPRWRALYLKIRRRRFTALVTCLVVFVVAGFYLATTTRRYSSSSTLQLQKSDSGGLGLDSMMGDVSGAGDSLSVNVDLQTQVGILESGGLALAVAKRLNLEDSSEFQPHPNPLTWLLGLLSPSVSDGSGKNAPLEMSAIRRDRLLTRFKADLDVNVVPGTRLIEVNFTSRDRAQAAAVTNALVEQLISYTFQTKYEMTSETAKWLESQLEDLRKQSESMQAKLIATERSTGLFGLGGTDPQGRPIIYSPAIDQLQQKASALSQAEMNTILKGSVYHAVENGDAELISQLSGTTLGSASQGVASSLALIQQLRGQEATLQSQIANDSAVFGARYPKLIEEQASLVKVKNALDDETRRIVERAKNDFDIAKESQRGAQAIFDTAKGEAGLLNDRTIDYVIQQKEADQSTELYQDLLKRLREAGVLESLHSSNITVVDHASTSAKPVKPNVLLVILGTLFFGPLLGLVAASIHDTLDDRFKSIEELDQLGLPVLGILPTAEGDPSLMLKEHSSKSSPYSESVRRLRSTVLLSGVGYTPKVLMVTSSVQGEGKSTTTLALARLLTLNGRRVLIMEADLRKPTLRGRLSLPKSSGLSDYISHRYESYEGLIHHIPNEPDVMLAGTVPPYPSEMLGSARFADLIRTFREAYDFVIIDTPPVLPVTDAQVIQEHVDITLMVARPGVAHLTGIRRAFDLLVATGGEKDARTVGIVVNGISARSDEYYSYYGMYASYYGSDEEGGDV